MLGVRQRRHVALRHEAFFVSRQNRLCRRVFFNRLWNNVYDRWITSNFPCRLTQKSKHNKWLEILTGEDFPLKLLWRTPTKIHRRRIEEGKREAERTSLSIAKATSSTQRPQTCTEASAKYYIITLQARLTASETDEERDDTDFGRFKKRRGDQATFEVYSQIILSIISKLFMVK